MDEVDMKDAVQLGSRENQWDTDTVVKIHGDYFHVVENGGWGGARQRDPYGKTTGPISVDVINETEARRLLLSFNCSIDAVATLVP